MTKAYAMVVIGGSAGALTALGRLLPLLPKDYPLPVVIVVHLHPQQNLSFIQHLAQQCQMTVKEAEEKERILPGVIYFAPPNYHLLVEDNLTFSISVDPKVNFARPSIDVLFESAAEACGPALIGVILTGANQDGAEGLRQVKARGGLAIVQNPQTAECKMMPQAAIQAAPVDDVLSIPEIASRLVEVVQPARIDPPPHKARQEEND